MFRGITILLLLFLSLRQGSACRCIQRTPEELVQNNDFVGIVTVKNNGCETEEYQKRFVIRVIESWKGGDDFKFIETAKDSAACGVDLTPGRYLIAATIKSKNSLQMNSCGSFYKETASLSVEDKESLREIAAS